jgi:hypothetical protein
MRAKSEAKQEIIHEAANATAAEGGEGRTRNSYPEYTRLGAEVRMENGIPALYPGIPWRVYIRWDKMLLDDVGR